MKFLRCLGFSFASCVWKPLLQTKCTCSWDVCCCPSRNHTQSLECLLSCSLCLRPVVFLTGLLFFLPGHLTQLEGMIGGQLKVNTHKRGSWEMDGLPSTWRWLMKNWRARVCCGGRAEWPWKDGDHDSCPSVRTVSLPSGPFSFASRDGRAEGKESLWTDAL